MMKSYYAEKISPNRSRLGGKAGLLTGRLRWPRLVFGIVAPFRSRWARPAQCRRNYVVSRKRDEVAEPRALVQGAMIYNADVADEAQVQAMFAAAVREFGTIASCQQCRLERNRLSRNYVLAWVP